MLKRTVAATALPVLFEDAKMHLRVSDAAEDVLIQGILAASCELIGEKSGRVMAPETWEYATFQPKSDLKLPKNPVVSVTSITYSDPANATQTANLADFDVISDPDCTVISPKPGKTWPICINRADAFKVTFVAGYASIPDALRAAVLLMVGHFYENREATVVGTSAVELPMAVDALVAIHKVGWAGA